MSRDTFEPFDNLDPLYKSAAGTGHEHVPVGTRLLLDREVFSPVMVLKQSAITHNLGQLERYSRTKNVLLAPHGKTTMSPELTQAQLAAGAWAISAATPAQVRAFAEFGVNNVLLANELVDPAGIAWIANYLAQHRDRGFLCYVDSLRGVEILDSVLASLDLDVVFEVLLEFSDPSGRTGIRSFDTALAVARSVLDSPRLRLRGVAGYEGALASDRDSRSIDTISAYCRQVAATAAKLDAHGVFEDPDVILSVGGGAFFDVVVDILGTASLPHSTPKVVIRPGSYVTHDDGLYERIAAFAQPGSAYSLRPALEIWGRILSRPEPGLAFADFGRRDVPFDQGLPMPHQIRDFSGGSIRSAEHVTVTALNDQHAYLRLPADDPIAPGDWIGCGVSHPCTAFDKWRNMPVVDDDYVVTGSITTYF